MRKINTFDFNIAKRTTARDINRRIALNLIRAHEPISRADLARKMDLGRGVITVLINELIGEGVIFEGAKGDAPRGRKPKFLYVKTDHRSIIAVDIRFSRTYLMLTDFAGRQIALESFETIFTPELLVKNLVRRIHEMLAENDRFANCEGIGIVIPGIIENKTGRILRAPALGWENVDIKEPMARATGLPVKIENAPKACALAQIWLGRNNNSTPQDFIYVSVSDGVGVGIVIGGELVRGRNDIAGEFGHVSIERDGNLCACGKKGCWETFISNPATIARHSGKKRNDGININDVIAKARAGDERAIASLKTSGDYLGIGLANLINIFNPEAIYIGGEITTAWDIIQESVTTEIRENVLIEEAAQTPIRIAPTIEYPRLRGAASLIVAPTFAALKVA